MDKCNSKRVTACQYKIKILPDGKKATIGHQFVKCHMVFDIKIEDIGLMTMLVVGSHMAEVTASIVYVSVMLRETVRIALMITTLNNFEVKMVTSGMHITGTFNMKGVVNFGS